MCFFSPFSWSKRRDKYYNKWSSYHKGYNVQSRDQEETKLSSTFIRNIGTHTVIDDKHDKSDKW